MALAANDSLSLVRFVVLRFFFFFFAIVLVHAVHPVCVCVRISALFQMTLRKTQCGSAGTQSVPLRSSSSDRCDDADASMRIMRPHVAPIEHSLFQLSELMTLVLGFVGPVVAEVRRSELVVDDHAGQRIVTMLPDGTLFVWKKMRVSETSSIEYLCRREWPATGDVSMSVAVYKSVAVHKISLRNLICDRGIVVFGKAPINASASAGHEKQPAGIDSDLYNLHTAANVIEWLDDVTTPQVRTMSMLDWRALAPLPRNGNPSVRTDWLSNIGQPVMLPFVMSSGTFSPSISALATDVVAISFDGSMIMAQAGESGQSGLVLYRVDYTESHVSLVRTRAMPTFLGRSLMRSFVVGTTRVCGVYVSEQTRRRLLYIEPASRGHYRYTDLGDDNDRSYHVECVYPTFFVARHTHARIHKIFALPVHQPATMSVVDFEGYTILPLEPMSPGGEWSRPCVGGPATSIRAYPHRFMWEAQREDDGAWYLQPFGVSTADFCAGMGDATMMQERLASTSTRPVS